MRLKPAILLDRDGVINFDRVDYVKNWSEFQFRPGTLGALRSLYRAGREIYILTNQAGIGRGLYTAPTLLDMHLRMQLEIQRAGGMIHGIVFCPHHPDDNCFCRKPLPGMFQIAAVKFGIDLSRSFFIGDAWRDISAGQTAGCGTIFLRTHFDLPRQRAKLATLPKPPDFEAADLAAAAELFLNDWPSRD